jgi:type IV pilus assembly protein PilF
MIRAARVLLVCLIALGGACTTTTGPGEKKSADERAELHAQLAANYMQRNQYDVALSELNKALKISPRSPVANYVMALLKTRLKELDDAERYYKRALDANPKYSEARHYYAVYLCGRGSYGEALQHFDQVLSDPLYSGTSLAYAHAGECVLSDPAREAASAEVYLEPALAANPRLANALRSMATVRYQSGNYLSARAFMQRYFDVGPETPQTLLLAVRVELALGAAQAADEYAVRLKRRFPRSEQAAELAKLTQGSRSR